MKMSPKKAAEIARFVDVFVNTNMSLKEILAQYKPDEVLSCYKPKEVLSRYKPKEVLSHYKPEDILSGLDKKQIWQLKQHLKNM
jgi:hypothetical protein